MRYKITLSYDGAPFCGWQVQPASPSVQATLQNCLSTLLREDISVVGAGRTDTGVNAVTYVAHFDGPDGLDPEALGYKLNAILPRSVTVHEILPAGDDFHARFSARSRTYLYFLHRCKDPFAERFSLPFYYPLDLQAMNEAAALIPGRRDFSCFEKSGGAAKTPFCTVTEALWQSYTPQHVALMGFPAKEGDYLYFRISADRFLRNMVRATVGTLLEIGRGRYPVSHMSEVLDSGSRGRAGESVPGNALFLSEIQYF